MPNFFPTVARPSRRSVALAAATAVAASLALLFAGPAPSAQALVYWGTDEGNIYRADLNGKRKQMIIANAGDVRGIAVTKKYVFWVDYASGKIGRANVDGTGIRRSFITGSGEPSGIAVGNGYVYWTNAGSSSIGRAKIDGSDVNQSFHFIPGAVGPYGIAVNKEFVFWSNFNNNSLMRLEVEGGVTPGLLADASQGVNAPRGMALADSYVYWSNGDASVGRGLNTGGSITPNYIGGGSNPRDIAVLGDRLYWTINALDAIAVGPRDNPTGDYNPSFIDTDGAPWGIDVENVKTSKPSVKVTKVKVSGGVAKVTVKVSGPGRVKVSGKGLKTASRQVKSGKGGKVTVKVKAKAALIAAAKANGSAAVKAKVAFKLTVAKKAKNAKKKIVFRG